MVGTKIGTDPNVHRATLTVGSSLFVFISLSRERYILQRKQISSFNNLHFFLAAQEVVFFFNDELNLFVLFQKLTHKFNNNNLTNKCKEEESTKQCSP